MLFRSALLSATLLLSTLLGLATALALPPDASLDPIASHEARLSNAARFQRGLPPQRPRQLFTPDRAARALSPRSSNSAMTAYYAEVAYASDPNTVIGYLALSPTVYGVAVQTVRPVEPLKRLVWADLLCSPFPMPILTTRRPLFPRRTLSFTRTPKPTRTTTTFTCHLVAARKLSHFPLAPWLRPTAAHTPRTTAFGGSGSSASSLTPIWDFSDFDTSGHIALTYVAAGSTAYNLYIDPSNGNKVYGAASAAAVNSVYSTSISETDEVLVTLVKET